MTTSEPTPPSAPPPPKRKAPNVKLPSRLAEAARVDGPETLKLLETSSEGLSESVAAARLEQYGPNEVSKEKHNVWSQRLWHSVRNPLVILLSVLAGISFYTAQELSDYVGAWLMVAMVFLGVALRFIQESKADSAAAKLKAMIKVTATVVRDGQPAEVPLQCLVPGDVVKLSAGDMIPGDVRVLSAKDLFIIQATLTGESLPVEKFDTRETRENISPLEYTNLCFLGTSVESGSAQAVVVETGSRTYLGGIASSMSATTVETSFDKGIKKFTYLMLSFMLVMVPAVFFINALSKSPSVVNPEDITNLPSLTGKLQAKSDPVSAYISSRLDPATTTAVAATQASPNDHLPVSDLLVSNLNAIVSGPSIYAADRFRNVTLSPETQSRLKNPGRHDFRLNRLLLQDAYPTEIKKSGKHDWAGAFLFALAVAVGLTPEMLPMIVSVCLSKGALAMSKKKVIVKRLNSIQNFGAMDVLCTDKTGTLTRDHVILEIHCDVFKNDSDAVLLDAYLISHFQTGLKNVLDRAVLSHPDAQQKVRIDNYKKVDEIPFDFSRRMMSVIVETPGNEYQILTKGAPEAVFARCTHFESEGEILPMEPILIGDLIQEYNDLSADGFRVLAVALRKLDKRTTYSKADESELTLKGYIAFLDPPKESATTAIAALQNNGVKVKVLTGDNDLVTRKVCKDVGLDTSHVLLGNAVENMTDEQLRVAVEPTQVFARLSPTHKQRIVEALRHNGHVVGFMGDGINDAPALRAADVGLSVDNAVDIAKESADMILLEKNLMVLEEGVLEGRKVFVNILKYIRMGASSNFGNMFSVLGASAFLPYQPMLPIQILTNNLLYDFSQVAIPTDNVNVKLISKPQPWDMGEISRFILFIGPVSSIFDYTTFFVMLYLFGCWVPTGAPLFHTGWFVESLMTQTLIIHVIRTRQIPFIQAKASTALTLTTVIIMAISAWLPYSPLAKMLALVPLPWLYWPILFGTLICYVILTQLVKMWLIRKKWL
ncbi:MAG TPA: magnesium-translocating P-type ATPase [Verrucomicrobiae bacterium]|jgi:magnesium-transporting ATPase (P-type)